VKFDIVSIGEPLIEFNQTRPGKPLHLQGFGGDSSNMAIAAARQGARVAYFTRLGDDEFGRAFRALWRKERVDAASVATDPAAHTGVYFVSHGPKGHVFSYLRAGSAASRMAVRELPLALLRSARFVHASGISLAISESACDAVLEAFKAAQTVSFDSNLRLRLWPLERARAMIGKAAALADYFFPSAEDAAQLSGLEDPDALVDWAHGLGAKNVFLKLGQDGVIVSDGKTRTRLHGHKVKAVDGTGAGDCFCGATLARLAAGDSLIEAARYGNAAAALKTTGYGAVAPIPSPAAVKRLLTSGSPSRARRRSRAGTARRNPRRA
jgi:2-dehydro-3-deoxygluconokinase